jgi:hypothetical protein
LPELFFILGLTLGKDIGQLVVVINELTKRGGMVPVKDVLRINRKQGDIGRRIAFQRLYEGGYLFGARGFIVSDELCL